MYFRARYYDPGQRRFTQEDPIGSAGGPNAFGYVGGQVLSARDPSGMVVVCTYTYHTTWLEHPRHPGVRIGERSELIGTSCEEFGYETLPGGPASGAGGGAGAPVGQPPNPITDSCDPPRPDCTEGESVKVTEEDEDCVALWIGAAVSGAMDLAQVRPLGAAYRVAGSLTSANRFLTAGRNLAQQAGQLAASGRNFVGAAAAGYEAFIAGRAALGAARLDALKGAFGAALGTLAPEFSMTGGGDMQLVRNLPFWIGTTFRTYEAIACSVNAATK